MANPPDCLIFSGANARPCDDKSDLVDAEFGTSEHGDYKFVVNKTDNCPFYRGLYDETQAVEIIAVEPGWLCGEMFYDPREHNPEDDWDDFGIVAFLADRAAPVEGSCDQPSQIQGL
jgi:hypothetical protein